MMTNLTCFSYDHQTLYYSNSSNLYVRKSSSCKEKFFCHVSLLSLSQVLAHQNLDVGSFSLCKRNIAPSLFYKEIFDSI